jgi:hypothetical protein
LERRCTFKFVQHRKTPKQRQTIVISDTDPLASQFAGAPLFDDWTIQGGTDLMDNMMMEIPEGVDATLASTVVSPPFYDTSAFDLTDCMIIPNVSLDGPREVTNVPSSDLDCTVARDPIDTSTVAQDSIETDSNLPPTSFGNSLGSTLTGAQAVRAKAMNNSPLGLLNSTMNLRLENEYLTLVFHSLTIALYVRYLSPPSDVFANERPYKINFEQSEHQLRCATYDLGSKSSQGVSGLLSTSSASQCVIDNLHNTTCIEPSRLQNSVAQTSAIDLRVHKVTMIGVALFLDHFSPIYGYHRSKLDRQEDQAAHLATVRAFVLANAPIASGATDQGDDTSMIFENAWLEAYHHLNVSMTRKSFTLAYTVFTFDLLPVPLSLSSDPQYMKGKERLLRHSVQKLQGLLSTVTSFCSRMSDHSKYRSLLEACKQTMEWHGYVRDTISAFINGSRCAMTDTLRRPDGESTRLPY